MKQPIKKFSKVWIDIIGKLIDWNEKILFYPKLKSFYQSKLTGPELRIIDVGANKGNPFSSFIVFIQKFTFTLLNQIKRYSIN